MARFSTSGRSLFFQSSLDRPRVGRRGCMKKIQSNRICFPRGPRSRQRLRASTPCRAHAPTASAISRRLSFPVSYFSQTTAASSRDVATNSPSFTFLSAARRSSARPAGQRAASWTGRARGNRNVPDLWYGGCDTTKSRSQSSPGEAAGSRAAASCS